MLILRNKRKSALRMWTRLVFPLRPSRYHSKGSSGFSSTSIVETVLGNFGGSRASPSGRSRLRMASATVVLGCRLAPILLIFLHFYPENFLGCNLIGLIGFPPSSKNQIHSSAPPFGFSVFLFRILPPLGYWVACNDHSQRRYMTAGNSF